MKNRGPRDGERNSRTNFSKSIRMKKKNIQRLGGGGLSLEAFANAKSTNSHYNPALLKKQREFYKNAKYVSKYKKSLKQQSRQNDLSSASRPQENERETGYGSQMHVKDKKIKKKTSLKDLYEKKREEEEKARIEKEAIFQAKREKREKAEAQRKATREKMFKKTRFGQPVMKYRIEHLLQSIQNSN